MAGGDCGHVDFVRADAHSIDWRGMLAVGLLGVLCAWLRMRSGSMIPPLIAHAGCDLLAMISLVLSLA